MKTVIARCLPVLLVLALVPALVADVKTREKSSAKLEGWVAKMLRLGGESTSTMSLKGSRMASISDNSGTIIDVAEEKFYTLDLRGKEYTVMTFAEMRKMIEDAKKQMAESMKGMSEQDKAALKEAGQQLEFDSDVKETGQRKQIAGYDAREVVITLTMRAKGQKLEESGGFVATNTIWFGPKIAALDEMGAFGLKFAKAMFGDSMAGMDPRQSAQLSMFLPGLTQLTQRLSAEKAKLQGTSLADTMLIETVKSAEQMKQNQSSSGGGGIGGMLAKSIMKGSSQPRTKTFTSTREVLSVATTVSDADVAIPAGFKEKKR
jgi:hypothetical protein